MSPFKVYKMTSSYFCYRHCLGLRFLSNELQTYVYTSQRRICTHLSSAGAVLPMMQPRDKTVSKEDILCLRGRDLCHIYNVHVCVIWN